ncbi:MAG: hypothetical protein CMJ48_15120 [Planctomycetaceae bacterium]|nr:hypothetical protein [Planctomycetaceae bacterium]
MAEEQDRQRSWGFWVAVVPLFLVFVVYPASLGPALWVFWNTDLLSGHALAVEAFYTPLEWAAENVPGVGYVMGWYRELWWF